MVTHGDNHTWFDLLDNLFGLFGIQAFVPANGNKKNIGITDFFKLFGCSLLFEGCPNGINGCRLYPS